MRRRAQTEGLGDCLELYTWSRAICTRCGLGEPTLRRRWRPCSIEKPWVLDATNAASMTPMKQVNPITARLRDILRNYSSAQLLNELLQNADDAGSREFKVLIDGRENAFGKSTLLSPELARTQGPALYQFDDEQFKPEDYQSIQRVGDGTKIGDPTKTGQFGLGFNSVYHVTDTPMFISGKDFVVFDPHETHLPDGMPGLCEDAAALAARCPGHSCM